MTDAIGKVPVKSEGKTGVPAAAHAWYPFDTLRREIDRLFEDFDGGMFRRSQRSLFDFAPFGRARNAVHGPAVDIAEKAGAFEITAELPGIDEKNVEVTVANGGLTIRGEKKEEKEEEKKDYFMSERRYGSFERFFAIPEGVDADRIAANFKNGVLTVSLPKTAAAQKQEKKIPVKAA